ncbi:hypothetical protein C0W92_03200 [Photobacterium angustum]|uniref:Uncharacterized protein n=1 Tax=Photobacterium angustum TaxID=661 RepID=A0A855SIC7_PHOAN|nr:hypothetical protein [Photobacterium angustum]KJG23216.1 membrane protein [Photobacterium angustum]KJG30247.1 membrane protein [Photobacterium angustum]KJG30850.1 membrane protein [Photobacterium angustum]KJG48849.1 membrane protein [Photobacterium angustum]PSW92007.1 hypothetical protein C0W92_03200 [Photobacterium angustum]
MFFNIEMTAAVVFFLAMLTRTCFLKSTWQQLMTVALQVISVWCLIHLFLSHVYPEFLFAKNVISVCFSMVFILAGLKDRYESDVYLSHQPSSAAK